MAYEPKDLGTYTVMKGCHARKIGDARTFIGISPLRQLGYSSPGPRIYAFADEPRERILVANETHAAKRRANGDEPLADFKVTSDERGKDHRIRSYLAVDATRYLDVREGDTVTYEYGEQGKYFYATVEERQPRPNVDADPAIRPLYESDVFKLDERGWSVRGRPSSAFSAQSDAPLQ